MKKRTVLLCLIMALVSLCAHGEDTQTDTPLWPAYDPITGLWGYIAEDGAWGIAPQYHGAYHFHGDCAIVDMGTHPDAYTPTQGIVDETGAFLLEATNYVFDPCEFLWEPGDIFFIMGEEGDMGWFNISNRYFSGLYWRECNAYADSGYVVVDTHDTDTGLADRTTGEYVLEPVYSMTGMHDDRIENGFLVVERDGIDGCELIEIGVGVVELPEGVYLDHLPEVSDGLIVFSNEEGLEGYINTAGEIVIPAQYDIAEDFIDGYAAVSLVEEVGISRIIDRQGRTVWLLGEQENRWDRPYHGVVDGALWVEGSDGTWGLVEPVGALRCRHTLPEEASEVFWLHEFSEDGPIWVEYALGDDEYLWGLMSREGELLGEPRWQEAFFGEDLVAVCEDDTWGYVDLWGNTVLPFIHAWAEAFDGALARVRFDEATEGYINRAGEIVYQWTWQEE